MPPAATDINLVCNQEISTKPIFFRRNSGPMRILVEPGSYSCLNMGDVAMLQVAVSRLIALWPDARISIVTRAAELLRSHCPAAVPVLESGKRAWFQSRVSGRLQRRLPPPLSGMVEATELAARQWMPSLVGSFLAFKMKLRHKESNHMKAFLEEILNADLVMATGTGMITDHFHGRALDLLDTLDMANRLGISTAMFSQGLGPVTEPGLLAKMRAVLPAVQLIAVRENLVSPQLLESVGVSRNRILCTGDDALELAFNHRAPNLGNAIGVNLRIAEYSQVDPAMVESVRAALQNSATKYGSLFVAIPILYRDDADLKAIRWLLSGCDNYLDDQARPDTPLKVIAQISRCRLVVTGSYHGAVLAVGQGIPAVVLARSQYYLNKFLGLREQFGNGCQVIALEDDQFPQKLTAAIDRAWITAEDLKPVLLASTEKQILSSTDAYRQVADLVVRNRRS
jgi:colanic acid/amylovoran biosynthesis protein